MARLLADSPEGAKVIPFALGKLRALRAQGFSQVTQRYEVMGFLVRVTINGADEFIEVRGGAWDYLVLPASTVHPEGITIKDGSPVSPRAALTLTSGQKGLTRDEHTDLVAGPHDWISTDAKRSLSYNHGHGFRYALGGGAESFTGERAIYRAGVKITTDLGVKGAAVARVLRLDGSVVQRLVYATYVFGSVGASGVRLVYLDETRKRPDGSFEEVEFASWDAPAGTVIAQPTFFSGDGRKFVTVLETVTVTGAPPDELYTFGRPRTVVRGTIAFGSSDLEASFSTGPLDETPDAPPATTNEQLYGTGADYYYFGNPKTVSSYQTYGYTGRGAQYSATTGYEELGYSRTTTASSQTKFIGLDMAADGTELLIERVTTTRAHTFAEETAKSDATGTGADYALPGGFWTVALSSNRTAQRTARSGGESSVRVSVTVNKTPLFDIALSESSTVSTRSWSETYSGSWAVRIDYVFDGDVYPPTVESQTTSYSEDVNEGSARRAFSMRDIDARNQAIAVVQGEYTDPFDGTSLRPLKVDLVAQCHGHTARKTIFDGVASGVPPEANGDRFFRRAIASRRPGEFVICFSFGGPASSLFPVYMEASGEVDHDPLFALRRKDKTIAPAPDKFSLDKEPGFRFDPVHVL